VSSDIVASAPDFVGRTSVTLPICTPRYVTFEN